VGGFGEVYYATSDAGKEVALKHVQRNLDIELRGVGQCLNLKHPNLIALYDIKYDDGGEGWVVMEYVPGESLKDVVDRNPNGLPRDAVHHWLNGICAGVTCLHDHGIVHRDLKPGNIFNDDGIVKIGDYGLSKFISVSRRSGQTESVGTFHYMAPEIGKGSYGREIDVYALGIMLYEMLTGRVPFEGESSQEIIMKHLTAEPDLSGIPQPYADAIAGALAKDPQDRISTVTELWDRLGLPSDISANGVFTAVSTASLHAAPPRAATPRATTEPDLTLTESHADMVFGPVETVAQAEAVDNTPSTQGPREPVAAAVSDGWHSVMDWWNHARLGTAGKFLLLLAAVFLLVTNVGWLLPVALLLGIFYLAYRLIWNLVVTTGGPRAERQRTQNGSDRPRPDRNGHQWQSRPVSQRRRRQQLREFLGERPLQDRIGELTGSMLMSACVAAVLGLVMMVVGDQSMQGAIYLWGPFYIWLVVVATVGAWAVLIPAKLWEGREDAVVGPSRGPRGEQVLRRFAMLVLGLAIGWLAFGLGSSLMVKLPASAYSTWEWLEWSDDMFDGYGQPVLSAYLIHFAGIFVVLRWWRQADPMRNTRLSLWDTALAVVCGLLLPFPQPWGFMMAMTISLAVQLSAPWFSPSRRTEIRQAMEDV
jgi:hypothetical protein